MSETASTGVFREQGGDASWQPEWTAALKACGILVNVTPCGGPENQDDGCGITFPLLQLSTVDTRPLCVTCRRRKESPQTAKTIAENLTLAQWLQCSGCSLIGSMITDPCGACKRKLKQIATLGNHPQPQSSSQSQMMPSLPQQPPLSQSSSASFQAPLQPQPTYSSSQSQPQQQYITQFLPHLPTGPWVNYDAPLIDAQSLSFNRHAHPSSRQIGPAMTPDQVNMLRKSATGSLATYLISFEARRSNAAKSVDRTLGQHAVPYPENTTLQDVLVDALRHFNSRWTKQDAHAFPLMLEDVELTAPNLCFPQGENTLSLTLKQYLKEFSQHNLKANFLVEMNSSSRGRKNKEIAGWKYEVYIDMARYQKRVDDLVGVDRSSVQPGQKRKMNSESSAQAEILRESKRFKSQSALSGGSARSSSHSRPRLASLFQPDISTPGPSTTTTAYEITNQIALSRIYCEITDNEAYTYNFKQAAKLELALLGSSPIHLEVTERGKSKELYSLSFPGIPGVQFVAKKLVDIGLGQKEPVSLNDAERFLQFDLVRLTRMRTFLDNFKLLAQDSSIHLSNVQVTEAFLAKAYSPELINAASVTDSDITGVYLVEPRRNITQVIKFSGTLGSTVNRTDQLYSTIGAFAHWVLDTTGSQYMFADIQGSQTVIQDRKGKSKAGEMATVLFDPMSHSLNRNSGMGDHGADGIKSFLASHRCNSFCDTLGLEKLDVLHDELETHMNSPGSDSAPAEDHILDNDDGLASLFGLDSHDGNNGNDDMSDTSPEKNNVNELNEGSNDS